MKKELDYLYFDRDGAIGGSQDWLPEWDMYYGGCAAVTACDLCLYLATRGEPTVRFTDNAINKIGATGVTRENFINLSRIMKPYISPRHHGVDLLEIYIEGLSRYWRDVGFNKFYLEGLSGTVNFTRARELVQDQIDRELPVPCLMLRHKDPALEDFEWHWFNLAGYKYLDPECANQNCQICNEKFFVKAVTYGEAHWLDFRNLWHTGHARRGGLIKICPSTAQ